MPCIHLIAHRQRHFLPHFLPGSMRCRFSPELVSSLPHAMRNVFSKSENQAIDVSSISPPSSSSLTQTKSSSLLIPKPQGEVSRVGRGGYTLKNVLEQEHGLEDGLYHKIRVWTTVLQRNLCAKMFSGESMLSGRQISRYIPCIFHSSGKIWKNPYPYL